MCGATAPYVTSAPRGLGQMLSGSTSKERSSDGAHPASRSGGAQKVRSNSSGPLMAASGVLGSQSTRADRSWVRVLLAADAQAFLWHELAGPRLLGTLGGQHSFAFAINEGGHVVGESETLTVTVCRTNEFGTFCEYERHPFLWQDGQMFDLGTLGGPNAFARAVNSAGIVVGGSETSEKIRCFIEVGTEWCIYRNHAFVWSDGQMIDLGEPGLDSFATGINEQGDIVGFAQRAPGGFGSTRPVIWRRQ